MLITCQKGKKFDWINLHKKCFKSQDTKVSQLFSKYELNDCRFALVYIDEKLVVSYSGIFIKNDFDVKVFLSTDTMSDGTFKGGSVLCSKGALCLSKIRGCKSSLWLSK